MQFSPLSYTVNKYFTELHKTLKQNNASLSQGDSGGGVEYNGKIYGVIRSSEEPDLCYPEAGFLKVCEYIDWINKIITKKWTMSFNSHFTVNSKTNEFL